MTSRELVKLYYRIGEVASIVGVQPHVLRYWETEFRTIRPQKSHKGQRVYSRRDVEKLLRVKDLLKNQGFTIAGAKRKLKDPEPAIAEEPGLSAPVALAEPVAPVPSPKVEAAPAPEVVALGRIAADVARDRTADLARAAEAQRMRHVLLTLREDIVSMLDGLDRPAKRPKLPSAP